jgi:hypothetical protein
MQEMARNATSFPKETLFKEQSFTDGHVQPQVVAKTGGRRELRAEDGIGIS